MTDERLANCPECGSDEVEVISERRIFVHCFRCGNHEYAPTETEAVEKWNFLAGRNLRLIVICRRNSWRELFKSVRMRSWKNTGKTLAKHWQNSGKNLQGARNDY